MDPRINFPCVQYPMLVWLVPHTIKDWQAIPMQIYKHFFDVCSWCFSVSNLMFCHQQEYVHMDFCTVLSAGVLGSGLCYVGMSCCVEQRGPVFTSAFSPSIQIYITIMDLAFFHEQIFLGSVIGSILIICGLYTLLWGKSREASQDNLTKPAEAVQCNESSTTAIDIIRVTNSGCPS